MKFVFIFEKLGIVVKFLSVARSRSFSMVGPDQIRAVSPKKTIFPYIYVEEFVKGEPLYSYCKNHTGVISFWLQKLQHSVFEANDYDAERQRSQRMKKVAISVIRLHTSIIQEALGYSSEGLIDKILKAPEDTQCHGDLNPSSNLLIDVTKNEVVIIDFEDSFIGSKYFDILFFLFYSCQNSDINLLKLLIVKGKIDCLSENDLDEAFAWFVILKLSKLSTFKWHNSIDIVAKRVQVIKSFKHMIESVRSYV